MIRWKKKWNAYVEGSKLIIEADKEYEMEAWMDYFSKIVKSIDPEQVFGCVSAGIASREWSAAVYGSLC